MSFLDDALTRQRESNKPIDATPMHLIEMLVTTNKGWIIRQALKGAAALGTTITTALVSHGVAISDPQAIIAALSTLAVGVAEMILSKVASQYEAK